MAILDVVHSALVFIICILQYYASSAFNKTAGLIMMAQQGTQSLNSLSSLQRVKPFAVSVHIAELRLKCQNVTMFDPKWFPPIPNLPS